MGCVAEGTSHSDVGGRRHRRELQLHLSSFILFNAPSSIHPILHICPLGVSNAPCVLLDSSDARARRQTPPAEGRRAFNSATPERLVCRRQGPVRWTKRWRLIPRKSNLGLSASHFKPLLIFSSKRAHIALMTCVMPSQPLTVFWKSDNAPTCCVK